jgi:opacity protein-like surface antigen
MKKFLLAAVVFTVFISALVFAAPQEKTGAIAKGAGEDSQYPTKANPIIIDGKGKRVLIYTEVHEMNVHQSNVHWGIVFREGKFQDRAILRAYAHHLDFHDALLKIGAKPGNSLTKDTVGKYVEGDLLDVRATWPGLGEELTLDQIFHDQTGKGFQIRFGGNRKAAEEQSTGCITCLESCWISISSNAHYPQTNSLKRFINPNSRFKGQAEVLPSDGKPVILMYRVAGLK